MIPQNSKHVVKISDSISDSFQFMGTNQQIQVPFHFDSMTYIWPHEWNILGKFISVDTEVRIMKIEEDGGHVTFISIPGIPFKSK